MNDDLKFFIDPGGKDNLYLQIRKQIEYWIATGRLQPGDRLPTIRDLEQQLGINRHTIRRAYLELEQQGLLRVQRGSGVSVAAGVSGAGDTRRDPAMDWLIDRTFREAAKRGYSPVAFARMLQQRAMVADRQRPSVAFVECSAHQARDLAAALEAQLGQAVVGVGLEAIEEDTVAVPISVRHVAVPAFHAHRVRELLKDRDAQLLTVHVEVGQRFVRQATPLLPAERPGVILRDRDAIPLYPQMVRQLLGLEPRVTPALMEEPEAVERLVERADLVFFSPPCKEFADAVIPEGKKRQEILFEFTPDAVELVRRSVGV